MGHLKKNIFENTVHSGVHGYSLGGSKARGENILIFDNIYIPLPHPTVLENELFKYHREQFHCVSD